MLRYRIAALALVALVLPAPGLADDKAPASPEGTWKVSLPWLGDAPDPAWLVRFQKKGDAWTGEITESAPGMLKGSIERVKVTRDVASFTFKLGTFPLHVELKLAGKKDKLSGVMLMRRQAMPIVLERTELKSLDPFEVNKDALKKKEPGHEAIQLALALVSRAASKKASAADVRKWGDRAIQSAELYGPALKLEVLLRLARAAGRQEGLEATSLQFARKAEQLLDPKGPPAEQKRILDALAEALERAGREEEAKSVRARVLKLNFAVKPVKFAGRKGKSDRVVLVELFDNAESAEALAADMAFAALKDTYKPSEVVLVCYHVHQPGADVLASPETEGRMNFYERVRKTPALVIDGKPTVGGGGDASEAQDKYEEYASAIGAALEKPSQGALKLAASREGDQVKITCETRGLARAGDDVRLRVLLVEEAVNYKGGSGRPQHFNVVRHMPGGEAGTVMKNKDGKYDFTVDLAKLKKDIAKYQEEYHKKRPFPTKERPLELKKLKVVAFVQDDAAMATDVLQAAQADVPGGKPAGGKPKDKPKE